MSDSATSWTIAHQASPSMGFSRQEYWSGLPLPSPGDLPDPGIKPRSPTPQADALPSEPPGKPARGQVNTTALVLRLTTKFTNWEDTNSNPKRTTHVRGMCVTWVILIKRFNKYLLEDSIRLPGGSVVKNPPANAGDTGPIPDLGGFNMPWAN